MIISRETLHEIAASWNLFSGRKFPSEGAEPAAGYIIIPGILLGITASLAAWSGTIVFGKPAAGIAAAILFTLIYELLTGWNGLQDTAEFLTRQLNDPKRFGEKAEHAENKAFPSYFIPVSLYLLRAAAIGFTAASAPGLFILILTAAYLIRYELVTFSGEMHEALMESTTQERNFTYRLAGIVFLLEPILSFHLINFARSFLIAVVMILICVFLKRKIGRDPEKTDFRRLSVSFFTAELLLLYTALAVL